MAHQNNAEPQPTTSPMPFKRMLRRKEVEHKTGLSTRTIYRLMRIGLFPQCSRIGIRAVAWDEQEVDAWLEACCKRDNDFSGRHG